MGEDMMLVLWKSVIKDLGDFIKEQVHVDPLLKGLSRNLRNMWNPNFQKVFFLIKPVYFKLYLIIGTC